MSRSIYKITYVHRSLFKDCLLKKTNFKFNINDKTKLKKMRNIPQNLYFWKRSSTINKTLLNKKIGVYNGKVFITLNVNKNIIGSKLGEFCLTRQKPLHSGKQKQVKKVQKVNQAQKRIEREQSIRKKRKKANINN